MTRFMALRWHGKTEAAMRRFPVVMSAMLAFACSQTPSAAKEGVRTTLTRLDCGAVQVNRLNAFSDTDAYPGQTKTLTDSCYLIRHGDQLMIWDAGLPAALKGVKPGSEGDMTATVFRTLDKQLAELGIEPDDIDIVGISHLHFDHIGQLDLFPSATLMIGKDDWDLINAKEPDPRINIAPFKHWLGGAPGKSAPVDGDKDIFGDGSVVMLDMPGHTPGHHSLLVRLKNKGPVLLTGDLAHFTANYTNEGVPGFNTDRADTLASFDRFKKMAANLKATVIIQHEPADVKKLPAFPKAAD